MTRDLSRLLRPRSIAVIGGGAWGANAVEQCLKMGFEGPVWPVHPTREAVHGLACHRALADLPEAPDAAFVCVNRRLTIEVVRELAGMGAGGAVCFASGFKEVDGSLGDGAETQSRLVAAAGAMPILGPNCYGLINYFDGALLWPDQHGGTRAARGVAVLTQSSNMLINITMQARGLPLGYCAAAGNQAQLGLPEIAQAMLEDPRVTALGLHIEGVADIPAFEALAERARALAKPIVALKVGRSAHAQAATLSHTASLTGWEAAGRALLSRLGIGEVESLPAFLETLKLLHVHGPMPGRRVAALSSSGGEASLIADTALHRNLDFRPLTEAERSRVSATLGPMVTVANPLDYHTFIWADTAAMTRTFAAMIDCGFDLSFMVLDFPRTDRASDSDWDTAVAAIAAVVAETGARVAVVATLPECMPEHRVAELGAAGIAGLGGLDEALAAAEAAADIGEAWAAPQPEPLLPAGPCGPATTLDELMAKHALAVHGLAVPEGRFAATPEEAAAAAAGLAGPFALKALGVAHKTEHGAVRLGLASAEAVAEAARSMAAPDGYLVEAMVAGGVAELLVGVVRDPAHGFALTIGAGGTLTEILEDSQTLMIPAPGPAVAAALGRLRVAPLLAGYRGHAQGDLEAVVEAVMAVQAFAAAEADRLIELDINPLIVTPERAVAADALIRVAAPSEGGA